MEKMEYSNPVTIKRTVKVESPLMAESSVQKTEVHVKVDEWQDGFSEADRTAGKDELRFD